MVAALRCAGVSDNGAGEVPAGIDRSSASNGTAVSSDAARRANITRSLSMRASAEFGGRKSGGAREMLDDRIERAVAVIGRALQ